MNAIRVIFAVQLLMVGSLCAGDFVVNRVSQASVSHYKARFAQEVQRNNKIGMPLWGVAL